MYCLFLERNLLIMKEIIDNYKISGDSFLQKSIMYI